MKKVTIIYGPQGSGKSLLAEKLASEFCLPDEIERPQKLYPNLGCDPAYISPCKKTTKLLIIDEVASFWELQYLTENAISESGFIINMKNELAYSINPNLIIICQDSFKPSKTRIRRSVGGTSYYDVDFIKCPK